LEGTTTTAASQIQRLPCGVRRARLNEERSDSGCSLAQVTLIRLRDGIPVRFGAWFESPVRRSTGVPGPLIPSRGWRQGGFTENGLSARTPPCISLPRPILPRTRSLQRHTPSPMLPAPHFTPAICDPFPPLATVRLFAVSLNQTPSCLEPIKSACAPLLPSSPRLCMSLRGPRRASFRPALPYFARFPLPACCVASTERLWKLTASSIMY
jgi:hypothetical protein